MMMMMKTIIASEVVEVCQFVTVLCTVQLAVY